jgi:L-ascorbate metabolism protein UlaG (beta-lactamase superfamily)
VNSFGKRPSGLRLERIKASPRFVGGSFRNTTPVSPGLKPGTGFSTMRDFLFGGQRRVPVAPLPSENPLDQWTKPPDSGLRATWLGHSTVLLEIDGFRVLTDPVWGDRVSPFAFAGPKRFQPVPVAISGLPPLDAVIISHDHYDHLDYPSILELAKLPVPFFTSLGVGAHLEDWGVPPERITEFDWWDRVELPNGPLSITAAPAQHFSGRNPSTRNNTLWSSFVVKGPKHSFFFSGDTGLTPEYGAIRERLGPFDLVMLEVGAFHPSWGEIHLGPEGALEALTLLGGGAFLPVHWGTFNLAIHAWDAPAETLVYLGPKKSVHLLMPKLGAAVEPAHADLVDPWWRWISALENKSDASLPADEPLAPIGEPID